MPKLGDNTGLSTETPSASAELLDTSRINPETIERHFNHLPPGQTSLELIYPDPVTIRRHIIDLSKDPSSGDTTIAFNIEGVGEVEFSFDRDGNLIRSADNGIEPSALPVECVQTMLKDGYVTDRSLLKNLLEEKVQLIEGEPQSLKSQVIVSKTDEGSYILEGTNPVNSSRTRFFINSSGEIQARLVDGKPLEFSTGLSDYLDALSYLGSSK